MKSAFQPDSVLLSSSVNDIGGLVSQTVSVSEATCMVHTHHDSHPEVTDGVTSMETNEGHALEDGHSRDEFDVEAKKRRVEEDLSADGNVVADYVLHENREAKLGDLSSMENAVTRDYQGAISASANASFAERLIEPTLVMLEVMIKDYYTYLEFCMYVFRHAC